MQITEYILDRINRLPLGYVFTYDDFDIQADKQAAMVKALNRLVQDGRIKRISPGRFYKPRISDFGELNPEIFQTVKDLLEQDGKIIGYLTGYAVYNQFGLTTQVPAIIQIGVNIPRKNLKRGIYRIRFIKQPNRITRGAIPLMRILDAIRNIKDIPGANVEQSCRTLKGLISRFTIEDQNMFLSLATKYNPATRALAGALYEISFGDGAAGNLWRTLNPLSTYKIGATEETLPNKLKWKIV